MIWLTWRQHRAQILVTAALLAALGLLLLGSAVEAELHISGHAPPGCPGSAPACWDLATALADRYDAVYTVFGWMPIIAPALIGAFWGAPLLGREYERGTHRLVWTQSVSVRRWLAVKLAVLGALAAAAGLALSVMVSLWRPVFQRNDLFGNIGVFNMVGVAPAAWWLYAFMLGTAAGALLRRTLPAMALVVAGITVTMFTLFGLSDHYAEPARTVLSDATFLADPDARLVSGAWIDPAGRELAEPPAGVCPRRPDAGRSSRNQEAYERCLFGEGYRYAVYFHPPSRFWRFQWTEAALLTAASLAFAGLTVHRTLRRRV
ncbi:ABC transporter permease [Planomonospora parontospora]|uniref:ABC transporter permease n=1 Tax=Planomonospora parontospora TaxID=58119 RepID=UPI0016715210|nr:ABC transporter permease [Planomonospora parontospora]GGL51882.1 transporter [Planomonospora parontospora subsp. antibiotica]GII19350.1 transporter [Planomonospora parontospora subsp. antibiotica]